MKTERSAVIVSAAAAFVVGVVALVVGTVTGSGAVLLDGAFNLSFFGTALLTLRIVRLLERPDDERYPFGYVQFEPLINLVKGLLILGVGLFALIDSALAIYRGGNEFKAGIALGYAVFAFLLCGGVLVSLRRTAGRLSSPLVRGDVDNWTVNTAISGGMLIAFILAIIFERSGMALAARLVDPILVILVVLLTGPVPIRIVLQGMSALLKRAPDGDPAGEIRFLIQSAIEDLVPNTVVVRALRPGRTTYVLAHIVLSEAGREMSVAETDIRRSALLSELGKYHSPVVLDLIFTTVAEFAEPRTAHDDVNLARA